MTLMCLKQALYRPKCLFEPVTLQRPKCAHKPLMLLLAWDLISWEALLPHFLSLPLRCCCICDLWCLASRNPLSSHRRRKAIWFFPRVALILGIQSLAWCETDTAWRVHWKAHVFSLGWRWEVMGRVQSLVRMSCSYMWLRGWVVSFTVNVRVVWGWICHFLPPHCAFSA